ncbi:unnamed protein product [Symbiodinium natans]|uniref:BTB domain-containing protein n=1 Tax=Symbiodinium natans TaxID=878477 RepID=A0A812MD95_9DINO|nr:unnamed protein product [Symbiodinium natans]
MEQASPKQADANKEWPGGSGNASRLNDITLDFGGGSTMSACSALLRLSSPVFDRMLECGMREAQKNIIKDQSNTKVLYVEASMSFCEVSSFGAVQQCSIHVEVAQLEDFEGFYNLLRPGAWNADKVTEANLDALLDISNSALCSQQYARCIASQARDCTPEDLIDISQTSPGILLDLSLRMRETQQRIGEIRGLRPSLANVKYMAENYIPEFQFNRTGYISRPLNASEVQNLSYLRAHIPSALEPTLDLLESLE